MKVVFSDSAVRALEAQFQYLIERDALGAARRVFERFDRHLRDVIAVYPKTGRWLPKARVFEAWVPQTPFIVHYCFDDRDETIVIVAIFHASQDRG